ncbi:MAG: hypothetical protein CL846_01415 [Crocinitomicaceae bacterium]|nr:hypothetical protein [Crocinitomicaceae bacterium]|tara:strand:- start:2753 stop:3889 length:1137 start_codon:yes stop_codon:yes gene_type:complete
MSKNFNVLVFIDWYYPAFKAGGPIRSVSNMIALLSKDIHFFIVTGDRDLLDANPFKNITFNSWIKKENYSIIYLDKKSRRKSNYKKLYNDVQPNCVYVNGVFSYYFSIKPLLTFNKTNAKLIVSPRGMFGLNSLKFKPLKKKIFLFLMNAMGKYSNVLWHLNSNKELIELKSKIKEIKENTILPNLSLLPVDLPKGHSKKEKKLNLISICRVLPIKNIHFLIKVLKNVQFQCQYNIIGPIEDKMYYQSCLDLINHLPNNVHVHFSNQVKPENILQNLNEADLFVSTSLNENFGHSIVEALGFSKPVLISDQTPWKNLLNYKAGADVSLVEEDFLFHLNKFANMSNEEYQSYSKGAKSYFDQFMNPNLFKDRYIDLLTN